MTAKEKGESYRKRHDWWRPALLVATLVLILVLARVFGIGERLGALRSWIEGLGSWGPVAFFFLYVAAVLVAPAALVGGLVAAALLFALGARHGLADQRFVLAGVAVAFALRALTEVVMLTADPIDGLRAQIWLIGTLAGKGWTIGRDFPAPEGRTFRDLYARRRGRSSDARSAS